VTQKADFDAMTLAQQIDSLSDCVAEMLSQYDIGSHQVKSINHEFNSTFAVTCDSGEKFALRLNVNSPRTLVNANAETFWVNAITDVLTPKPVANRDGNFVATGWHEASSIRRMGVLYTWLEGEEPGDEPTLDQLAAAGAAMARLHEGARSLVLPPGAELPDFADFFWGDADVLLAPDTVLTVEEQQRVATAKDLIETMLDEHRARTPVQPIHADIHPWNMMWHEGTLAIFDFDDSGIGLPVQDLATSLYYLDTDEEIAAFVAGYAGVRSLPEYSEADMQLLLLQRRIVLFNSLLQTTHPEDRDMIPEYRAETMRRIRDVLSSL